MKLLSRESKTLIGLFILTLALWLWMNLLVQVRQTSWAEQQNTQGQVATSVGAMFINAPIPVAPPAASTTGTVLLSVTSDPSDMVLATAISICEKSEKLKVINENTRINLFIL